MNLLNAVRKRLWLVVLIVIVGLVVVGGVSCGLSNESGGDVSTAEAVMPDAPDSSDETDTTSTPQELAPAQAADAEDATTQDLAAAEVLTEQETGSTKVDQTQIDRDDLDTYQGIPVGFTAEGYPYLGDPDAPVTLEEYSDFLCPFCARHFDQTLPALLDEYVRGGQVKYVFRDMPLVGLHPTAPVGHVAVRCVSEQGAAYFWAMHDQLFARQNEWRQLPDPGDFVASVAEGLGVDMAAYQECVASGSKDTQVQESVAAGGALGFNGTPSFQFIQNESGQTYTLVGALPVDTFAQWLDALIAGEAPPQEEEPEPPELPFWANAEGLAPDPDRPGFTVAGDPYKGNPDAALVVVEFADFQCDSCQRHALETQPTVDEQFVDTGHIMWVFKPLPLKEHAYAPAAAVAAECAGDQDQFWDMYHLLFESLEEWSAAGDPDAALLALAEELELNMDAFADCLSSRQALERVLADVYDAQGLVETTPTFVFLYGGRGNLSRGALPVDQFVRRLEGLLEQANAAE